MADPFPITPGYREAAGETYVITAPRPVLRDRMTFGDMAWMKYQQGNTIFGGVKRGPTYFPTRTTSPTRTESTIPRARPYTSPPMATDNPTPRSPVPYDTKSTITWSKSKNPLTYKPPNYFERTLRVSNMTNTQSLWNRAGGALMRGLATAGPGIGIPLMAAASAIVAEKKRNEARAYMRNFGDGASINLLHGARTIEQAREAKPAWFETIASFLRGE
jgi:hypothetical protein